jgi:hypothetical protein
MIAAAFQGRLRVAAGHPSQATEPYALMPASVFGLMAPMVS